MLPINQVVLQGKIVDGSIKTFQNAYGVFCCALRLRTTEVWRSKDGEKDHHEYHSVLIKDYGTRELATKVATNLCGGDRVMISGKIRNRLRKVSERSYERYMEIEADDLEVLPSRIGEEDLILEPRREGIADDFDPISEMSALGISTKKSYEEGKGFKNFTDEPYYQDSINNFRSYDDLNAPYGRN